MDNGAEQAVREGMVMLLVSDRYPVPGRPMVHALLATGAIRPTEVQSAFASPALITLASLFVIAYALELSGLLDLFIRRGIALCERLGEARRLERSARVRHLFRA